MLSLRQLQKLQYTLKANHEAHREHDYEKHYDASPLCCDNLAAILFLTGVIGTIKYEGHSGETPRKHVGRDKAAQKPTT